MNGTYIRRTHLPTTISVVDSINVWCIRHVREGLLANVELSARNVIGSRYQIERVTAVVALKEAELVTVLPDPAHMVAAEVNYVWI